MLQSKVNKNNIRSVKNIVVFTTLLNDVFDSFNISAIFLKTCLA